jgi:hypothetical protein
MLKPIDESIQILNHLNTKLVRSLEWVADKSVYVDDKSAVSMFYYNFEYGLILTVSYLKELNEHFSKALINEKGTEDAKKLMAVINIPKKEIQKRFPDLNEFRNHHLAHNLRIDKNNHQSTAINAAFSNYRIPKSPFDYGYLVETIDQINQTVNLFFPDSAGIGVNYIKSIPRKPKIEPQFNNVLSVQVEKKRVGGLMKLELEKLGIII